MTNLLTQLKVPAISVGIFYFDLMELSESFKKSWMRLGKIDRFSLAQFSNLFVSKILTWPFEDCHLLRIN